MNRAWRGASVIPAGLWLGIFCCLCAVVLAQEAGENDLASGLNSEALQARAARGNGAAQNELGLAYALGKFGTTNYVQAREWFTRAATQGTPAAQYNLASLYLRGYGVPQDFAEARRLYEEAAEQGFLQAQFTLGWMYAYGKGVEPDFKTAAKWFGLAAEQGDAEAQLQLGLLYLRGEDLKPNYVEAYKWINVAAGNGSANAIQRRRFLVAALTREEIRQGQALATEYVVQRTRSGQTPDAMVAGN